MYVQSCQNLVKTKSLTDPRRGTDDTAENGRLGLPLTEAEQHQRLRKVVALPITSSQVKLTSLHVFEQLRTVYGIPDWF